MVQTNGGDEIEMKPAVADPGYNSEDNFSLEDVNLDASISCRNSHRTQDNSVNATSDNYGAVLYPDTCLRFDDLICAKPYGFKLDRCYGQFYGGEITAIMGPSRSGRSTLFKILAGRRFQNCRGKIKVGNKDRITQHFKMISAYIPHHAILSNLTVKESMMCSAIACCPPEYSEQDRNKTIMTLLELLFTADSHLLHKKVYDLTLVEQRILCLATECLRGPKFIFINDPLKGLNIEHQMYYLRQIRLLAQKGFAIILCMKEGVSMATLQFIDQIYVLSKGQCTYSGKPTDLSQFYREASNDPTFPDIHCVLAHCAMNDTSQQVEDNRIRTRKAITGKADYDNCEIKPKSCVKHIFQGFSMCSRYSIALARQVRAIAYRLIYNTFIGLLMGGICFDVGLYGVTTRENAGYIYFSIIFLFIGAMVASARRTNRYMCIYQRERYNRWYSTFSFYLAKMLAELPVEIIMSVPFAGITYFMVGNPANLVYIYHVALCVFTGCMGHVFGVIIMAVSEKFEIQQTVAGVYITLNMVLMGYIFRIKYMNVLVSWAATLSPFHLLFKSFILNIYNSQDPLYCRDVEKCETKPYKFLATYGFEKEQFRLNSLGYIFLHLMFLHTVAFAFIASRGRNFDMELPKPHYNKNGSPYSVPAPSPLLVAREDPEKGGIRSSLKSCLKCPNISTCCISSPAQRSRTRTLDQEYAI